MNLTKREQQIMDVVHKKGKATAMEISAGIPDPPTLDAVRALIRILENKGYLKHIKQGSKHIYLPTQSNASARKSALKRVVDTFFGGSIELTVSTLISESDATLSETELKRLRALLQKEKTRSSK